MRRRTGRWCGRWQPAATTSCFSNVTRHGTPGTAISRTAVLPHRVLRGADGGGARYSGEIAAADLVIVGSYVPDGIAVGDGPPRRAGPDRLLRHRHAGHACAAGDRRDATTSLPRQIPRYDLYLSFTGGPTLERLEQTLCGAGCARPLYCSVDPDLYLPEETLARRRFDIGYLGTYSADRQPVLDRLMLSRRRPLARRPLHRRRPAVPGVDRVGGQRASASIHLAPAEHRSFYNQLRFTLNVTRKDMVQAR